MTDTGIVDNNHALLVGMIQGAIMRMTENDPTFKIFPIMLGSDYTNELAIERPSGTYRITVERIDTA